MDTPDRRAFSWMLLMRVLHVIDAGCDATQLQVLATLVGRGGGAGMHATVCSIDAQAARCARMYLPLDVVSAPERSSAAHFVPGLRPVLERGRFDVVHAWGPRAAVAVAGAGPARAPLMATILDPGAVGDATRWLRSLPRQVVVAAGSQVIRTALLKAGLAAEQVVVIRGPADFAAINRARQGGLRREIAGGHSPVLLLDGPASERGGQFYGLWAAAIVAQIHRPLGAILPYDSREAQRLRRFVREIRMEQMLIVPPAGWTWPELAACADVFLVPAADDVCTEPIATAMAAGVAIVGSAVRSIAEILADRHNALLCRPREPRALAARILTALEDHDLRRRVSDVARGQAYEVFSARGFLDNYARLYENVLAGRPAAEAVRDTAMAR